ncbi:MAG: Gfo/Idh/MocA family protein [Promethearchaeota archaeon]
MSDKISFGILGFGFMGRTHYENLKRNPHAIVKCVFSLDKIPRAYNSEFKVYKDWKRMITEEDIDAVVIATPTNTHKELAVYAAEHGKHIFLEKPMALNIDECNEVIEASKKNNIKLFVGHVVRFWPSYSLVKTYINENKGHIGDVKMLRLKRLSAPPNWSDWFLDIAKSGGVILDLSIHDIDYSVFLLKKLPERVFCKTVENTIKGKKVPVISYTTLDFTDAISYCEASWAGTPSFPFTTEAEIVGEDGIINFDNKTSALNVYSREPLNIDPYDPDGYYLEMDSFINSILLNKDVAVSGEDGKNAVALCLAAIKSANENRVVNIKEVI